MKPIQTYYNGYKFRSRLEARWAVFFDACHMKWEYEPEGFKLSDGTHYLPDFKITTPYGSTIWYEIKPEGTTEDAKFNQFESDLIDAFREGIATGARPLAFAVMLTGDPYSMLIDKEYYIDPNNGFITKTFTYSNGFEVWPHDDDVRWGDELSDWETPIGGYHPPRAGMFGLMARPHKGSMYMDIKDYQMFVAKLADACRTARSARFEHGETPVAVH